MVFGLYRALLAAACVVALTTAGCGGTRVATETSAETARASASSDAPVLRRLATFARMPSGVAAHDAGIFVAFPRWVEHGDATLTRLDDDMVPRPWPDARANDLAAGPDALHSVNGLHLDRLGRLWVLDNGRIDLAPAAPGVPKIVVFDAATGAELFRHVFAPDVAPGFANDLVYSDVHGWAFLSDTGMGREPALIVYDVLRDRSVRVLEGDPRLLPADGVETLAAGEPATRVVDGDVVPWRVGANPIALSPDEEWVFFGPLTGRELYRAPIRALRDESLDPAARAALVEVAGAKGMTDGIATGPDGALWLTDWSEPAVERRGADGAIQRFAAPELLLPIAIEPLSGGGALVTTSPLHRMPLVLGGVDARPPTSGLWVVGSWP
jgi:sugar lactone lactonase YvrE